LGRIKISTYDNLKDFSLALIKEELKESQINKILDFVKERFKKK
jgi:hypothetical protein